MRKAKTSFVCQQCGVASPGYLGRCPGCGAWNSMVETIEERRSGGEGSALKGVATPVKLTQVDSAATDRVRVPITELDRVLGGGIVPGSLVLLGGDPGIGKSTLVLQAASALARAEAPVL